MLIARTGKFAQNLRASFIAGVDSCGNPLTAFRVRCIIPINPNQPMVLVFFEGGGFHREARGSAENRNGYADAHHADAHVLLCAETGGASKRRGRQVAVRSSWPLDAGRETSSKLPGRFFRAARQTASAHSERSYLLPEVIPEVRFAP